MRKINYFILFSTLSLLLVLGCNSNPEHRNQVRMAGVWKIKRIQSDQYENNSISKSTVFESDKLGEITMLNIDVNDFNDCYMRLDSTVDTKFETNFNTITNEDLASNYFTSQWGTNLSSLKYVIFYEVNVNPVNAKSWTVSIQDKKLKKQKWIYSHFDINGLLTYIETWELEKQ